MVCWCVCRETDTYSSPVNKSLVWLCCFEFMVGWALRLEIFQAKLSEWNFFLVLKPTSPNKTLFLCMFERDLEEFGGGGGGGGKGGGWDCFIPPQSCVWFLKWKPAIDCMYFLEGYLTFGGRGSGGWGDYCFMLSVTSCLSEVPNKWSRPLTSFLI